MVICETLPLCPDTDVTEKSQPIRTEPMEVGPYKEGIVFIKVMEKEGDDTLSAEVGISPYGYDDWEEHWVTFETIDLKSPGLVSCPITNFGNWIRLNFRMDGHRGGPTNSSATVQAWFVGKE